MKNIVVVKIENCSFSFDQVPVIEKVSFEVGSGDYLGIIGPNGSGKTTLLRLMLGLVKPQKGNIYLFGQPISHFKQWTKIGYIPQKVTQFESRFPITVQEVVSLGRKVKSESQEKIFQILKLVEVLNLKDKLITQLSAGQQQRVFIAKALISDPELLILDEPTVGVDTKSQEKFYQLLSHLNKKKRKTIIIVSHDIDVIANEVKTIACFNRRLLYCGKPTRIIKEDYLEKLYGKGRQFITHNH